MAFSSRSLIMALLMTTQVALASPPHQLDLEEAKSLVLKNNPNIKTAREKLLQAEVAIDKAWVMLKPQLNAAGTYTHHGTEAAISMPDFSSLQVLTDPAQCNGDPFCISFGNYTDYTIQKQDTFGLMATVSQPLFLARAYTTIKSAYLAVDIAKLSKANLEDFMLHSVEVTYYGALSAQKLSEIAKNSVTTRAEHLRIARAKFEVGDTPKITVLRAEIEVNRAEQDVKRAENSVQLSKEVLALLIGTDPNFELSQPAEAKPSAMDLTRSIDEALATRRDLDSAKLELKMAERLKQDAWFRFLPSLALTGMFRLSDVQGFTNEYYSWNVGLVLNLPLYDGGMRYAALEEARSRIRQAQIKIDEKRANIASEIRQLWLKIEMAEANLIKARRAVELAKEQVELARVSFEAGAITSLEVLDANSVLFVTETAVVQEELSLQLAVLRLRAAKCMYNPAGSLANY